MKKAVVIIVVLAFLLPSVSIAGSSRNFHRGFHQGLGVIAAAAVVGIGAKIIHDSASPSVTYVQPAPTYYQQPYNPPRMDSYDMAYAQERMKLERQAERRHQQYLREQAVRDARRDFDYYR